VTLELTDAVRAAIPQAVLAIAAALRQVGSPARRRDTPLAARTFGTTA